MTKRGTGNSQMGWGHWVTATIKVNIDSETDMAVVLWCPVEDLKTIIITLTIKLTWLLSSGVQLKI